MPTLDLISMIEKKIVEFQTQSCEGQDNARRENEAASVARKKLLLGVIEILDFCNQFANDENSPVPNKISRKLSDLLKRNDVQEIVQSRVEPGLVRVVETRSEPHLEESVVLAVCRKGYKLGDLVLRPLEVIANRVI